MRKCRHTVQRYSGADKVSECMGCGLRGAPGESISMPFSYDDACKDRPVPDRLDEIREDFEDGRYGAGSGRGDARPAIRDLLNEIDALNAELSSKRN